jgi:hypothetical protein
MQAGCADPIWVADAQFAEVHCDYCRQAIYCLSKAIAHTPGRADADARWDRAVLHAELGELGKALRQLREVRQGCCRLVVYCRTGTP